MHEALHWDSYLRQVDGINSLYLLPMTAGWPLHADNGIPTLSIHQRLAVRVFFSSWRVLVNSRSYLADLLEVKSVDTVEDYNIQFFLLFFFSCNVILKIFFLNIIFKNIYVDTARTRWLNFFIYSSFPAMLKMFSRPNFELFI